MTNKRSSRQDREDLADVYPAKAEKMSTLFIGWRWRTKEPLALVREQKDFDFEADPVLGSALGRWLRHPWDGSHLLPIIDRLGELSKPTLASYARDLLSESVPVWKEVVPRLTRQQRRLQLYWLKVHVINFLCPVDELPF